MAVLGTYSSQPGANKTTLAQAIESVLEEGYVAGEQVSATTQAQRLAEVIATWVASIPVVVRIEVTDVGLQTAASPGSPTVGPAAVMELRGTLRVE